jgi:hypothetical protein
MAIKQPDPQIFARLRALHGQPKADLIRRYPSRLDMSHLRSEAKSTIISAILEAEFGRDRLANWNGRN